MTTSPTPEQRAEMAAHIDATEPGLLDDLGIERVVDETKKTVYQPRNEISDRWYPR